jgi:hypothetical protein
MLLIGRNEIRISCVLHGLIIQDFAGLKVFLRNLFALFSISSVTNELFVYICVPHGLILSVLVFLV